MVARIGTGEGYAGAAFAPEAWGKRRYAPSVRFVVVIGLVVAVLSGSAGASDGTSLRIRYWSEREGRQLDRLDFAVRATRRDASSRGGSVRGPGERSGAVRAGAEGRRLHPGLRRPTASQSLRHASRPPRLG